MSYTSPPKDCCMKKDLKHKNKQPSLPRTHRVTFLLNDEEQKVITHYAEKYKVKNKSRWYREVLMQHVFHALEKNHPTLFKENDMR